MESNPIKKTDANLMHEASVCLFLRENNEKISGLDHGIHRSVNDPKLLLGDGLIRWNVGDPVWRFFGEVAEPQHSGQIASRAVRKMEAVPIGAGKTALNGLVNRVSRGNNARGINGLSSLLADHAKRFVHFLGPEQMLAK